MSLRHAHMGEQGEQGDQVSRELQFSREPSAPLFADQALGRLGKQLSRVTSSNTGLERLFGKVVAPDIFPTSDLR